MIKFISTRGISDKLTFEEQLFATTAPDRGLYVPNSFPKINQSYKEWKNINYYKLLSKLVLIWGIKSENSESLISIFRTAYSSFYHPRITPLSEYDDYNLLELYHGPTRSFKDLAMQGLAKLIESNLGKTNKKICILGSTSGDTGSAAIKAFAGIKNVNIIILHPHNLISEIQKLQMTSVEEKNVGNLAIHGTFDDTQSIVKQIFYEKISKINLVAINSINLGRIILQIGYYYSCYFQEKNRNNKPINVVVPSGNFGNALAAWYAKQTGLLIDKIIIATNQNDVIHRVINDGIYKPKKVKASLSPAMDIQVASNFERLIFHVSGGDTQLVNNYYFQLSKKGYFKLSKDIHKKINEDFISYSITESQTINTIKKHYKKYNNLIDPHTAVGVKATKLSNLSNNIVLSTAHPAKFYQLYKNLNLELELPKDIKDIFNMTSKLVILENDIDLIKDFIINFNNVE